MDGMREILKGSLRRSLGAMRDEDTLAVAWLVACGKTLAERGEIVGYAGGMVQIEVSEVAWLRQMMSMQEQLASEMARIAGIKVIGIHFQLKGQNNGPWGRRSEGHQ